MLRSIQHGIIPLNPEVFHLFPRVHNKTALKSKLDLVKICTEIVPPFREDGSVVLLEAATKPWEMADKGVSTRERRNLGDLCKIGPECFSLV
jgi:hypothetical protein